MEQIHWLNTSGMYSKSFAFDEMSTQAEVGILGNIKKNVYLTNLFVAVGNVMFSIEWLWLKGLNSLCILDSGIAVLQWSNKGSVFVLSNFCCIWARTDAWYMAHVWADITFRHVTVALEKCLHVATNIIVLRVKYMLWHLGGLGVFLFIYLFIVTYCICV